MTNHKVPGIQSPTLAAAYKEAMLNLIRNKVVSNGSGS